jgi:hypothetical protein
MFTFIALIPVKNWPRLPTSRSLDAPPTREWWQRQMRRTMHRFDGFVARYMGDGALVYFGYPRAHEDDAERAIRAGLELIKAVTELKSRASLQARVGIATGLVVGGDLIGWGEAQSAASLARRRISRRGCRRLPSRTWSSSVTARVDFSAISLNWRTSGLGTSRASPSRRGPGPRCARVPWQAGPLFSSHAGREIHA